MADLSQSLPFDSEAFDDIVASLVVHYLKDWTPPLAELRRVLKPGGRLILSVNHPMIYKILRPSADYFEVGEHAEEFSFDGKDAVLTFWHRPLHAMMDSFAEAGFRVSVLAEPPFIFFVLEAS